MTKPTEKISAAEAEGRKREANIKKAKNRDMRKWANKYLKPGTLPIKVGGYGEGKVVYCPNCDIKTNSSVFRDKWYCGECGEPAISMTKTDFANFRKSQENDKDTNKHDREPITLSDKTELL